MRLFCDGQEVTAQVMAVGGLEVENNQLDITNTNDNGRRRINTLSECTLELDLIRVDANEHNHLLLRGNTERTYMLEFDNLAFVVTGLPETDCDELDGESFTGSLSIASTGDFLYSGNFGRTSTVTPITITGLTAGQRVRVGLSAPRGWSVAGADVSTTPSGVTTLVSNGVTITLTPDITPGGAVWL